MKMFDCFKCLEVVEEDDGPPPQEGVEVIKIPPVPPSNGGQDLLPEDLPTEFLNGGPKHGNKIEFYRKIIF